MNTDDSTENVKCQEVLQDVNNGKVQPWREKKAKNMILAESMKRLEQSKKANRVWWCACTLGYEKSLETGEKRLKTANFCRERLCPMCQWRRSKKVFYQVSRAMDIAEQRHNNIVPIFLTMTVRNCADNELSKVVGDVLRGWYQMTKHRKINRVVVGWFRALEVTYNEDTFHPHIHAILLVDKGYFKGKDYMHTTDWVQLWRMSVGLDYDPICDIRKVKANKGKHKAVAEVAKYTLKDSEYLTRDNNELTDRLVSVLGDSLRSRRLYAFGGELKKIAKEINAERPDEGDLIHIDDESIREDIAMVMEVYQWNFGLGNYYKTRKRDCQ